MNECNYCKRCKGLSSITGNTYAYICTDYSAFMGVNHLSSITEVMYKSTEANREANSACGIEGKFFQPVMFYKLRLLGKKIANKVTHRTVYRVYKEK